MEHTARFSVVLAVLLLVHPPACCSLKVEVTSPCGLASRPPRRSPKGVRRTGQCTTAKPALSFEISGVVNRDLKTITLDLTLNGHLIQQLPLKRIPESASTPSRRLTIDVPNMLPGTNTVNVTAVRKPFASTAREVAASDELEFVLVETWGGHGICDDGDSVSSCATKGIERGNGIGLFDRDYPNPHYVSRANVFSGEECDTIIALGKRFEDQFQTAVIGEDGEHIDEDYRRTDRLILLPEASPELAWIYRRLQGLVVALNQQYWRFRLADGRRGSGSGDGAGASAATAEQAANCRPYEAIQLLRYRGAARGHYSFHLDQGVRGDSYLRKLSVTVQLSDPAKYAGGALEVRTGKDVEVMPRLRGSATVFPSYRLHRVAPVSRGVRWSLVFWVHGCQGFA